MKRKRFSVERIVVALKRAELGLPMTELVRRVGVSEQSCYRWKKREARLARDRGRPQPDSLGFPAPRLNSPHTANAL
jgi:putative transposase